MSSFNEEDDEIRDDESERDDESPHVPVTLSLDFDPVEFLEASTKALTKFRSCYKTYLKWNRLNKLAQRKILCHLDTEIIRHPDPTNEINENKNYSLVARMKILLEALCNAKIKELNTISLLPDTFLRVDLLQTFNALDTELTKFPAVKTQTAKKRVIVKKPIILNNPLPSSSSQLPQLVENGKKSSFSREKILDIEIPPHFQSHLLQDVTVFTLINNNNNTNVKLENGASTSFLARNETEIKLSSSQSSIESIGEIRKKSRTLKNTQNIGQVVIQIESDCLSSNLKDSQDGASVKNENSEKNSKKSSKNFKHPFKPRCNSANTTLDEKNRNIFKVADKSNANLSNSSGSWETEEIIDGNVKRSKKNGIEKGAYDLNLNNKTHPEDLARVQLEGHLCHIGHRRQRSICCIFLTSMFLTFLVTGLIVIGLIFGNFFFSKNKVKN